MICDPKQCVFFPPPNGKVVTCMVLDTCKRCTPSISAKCSFGLTPSEFRAGMLRAYRRIASLSDENQSAIRSSITRAKCRVGSKNEHHEGFNRRNEP